MKEKKKYDIKSAKKMLLNDIRHAWYELGRTKRICKELDSELIEYAIEEILENDTESRNQYKKLLGLSYMVRGITQEFLVLQQMDLDDDSEGIF